MLLHLRRRKETSFFKRDQVVGDVMNGEEKSRNRKDARFEGGKKNKISEKIISENTPI